MEESLSTFLFINGGLMFKMSLISLLKRLSVLIYISDLNEYNIMDEAWVI